MLIPYESFLYIMVLLEGQLSYFWHRELVLILGTVFPITDMFSITPTLAYAHSVDSVITGEDLRVAVLTLDSSWCSRAAGGSVFTPAM
jgi:hypothetical protein